MKNPPQCNAKGLERLMAITDRNLMKPNFESALEAALSGGARLFQLREKELNAEEFLQLARSAARVLDARELVVNGNREVAREVGCGLHLPERDIKTLRAARRELGEEVLIGASCHSLEAALRAQNDGADYLVFGSVFPTLSHPESTPAGLNVLREIAEKIVVPVYAVGGINANNARACLDAGAFGVAVIRALWSTRDVAQAVRALVEALKTSA